MASVLRILGRIAAWAAATAGVLAALLLAASFWFTKYPPSVSRLGLNEGAAYMFLLGALLGAVALVNGIASLVLRTVTFRLARRQPKATPWPDADAGPGRAPEWDAPRARREPPTPSGPRWSIARPSHVLRAFARGLHNARPDRAATKGQPESAPARRDPARSVGAQVLPA